MKNHYSIYILSILLLLDSCRWDKRYETSTIGWDYNDPKNGGFEKVPLEPMETPPEMVLIEGCDFNQLKYKSLQQKFSFTINDSIYIDSAIAPFFISKYEETNFQYRSYIDFLKYHGLKTEYEKALPDTTVWLAEEVDPTLALIKIRTYFRNPAYDNYPVVGVTAEQAHRYAAWKTDRLNELILIREGVIEYAFVPGDIFYTDSFLLNNNNYNNRLQKLPTLDVEPDYRPVNLDGIILPRLRLITLAEWQWAVLSIGNAENKYILTPKPIKQRKMDKDHHFSYLYIPKNKSDEEQPTFYNIHSVYIGSVNDYGVLNLNSNVSELICPDSTHVSSMGGSWKYPENDYSAIYEKTHPLELNYKIPFDFIYKNDTIQKPNALTGFRLVMDYFGGIDESKIKRK